jgi:hypothetical protein
MSFRDDVAGDFDRRCREDVAGDFGRRCRDDVAGDVGFRRRCECVFECLFELLEDALGEDNRVCCSKRWRNFVGGAGEFDNRRRCDCECVFECLFDLLDDALDNRCPR